MDPFIATIVAALASGAVASAKDTAGEVVKDAYHAVRRYIIDRYNDVELKALEKDPKSKPRQDVVAEDLTRTDVANDQELPKLIQALLEALQKQAPDAAQTIGVNFSHLRAAVDVQIRRVGAAGPVKIADITAGTGSIVIEDVGYSAKN